MNSLKTTFKKTLVLSAKSQTDLCRAAQILRENNIVALPTETVYGLAAHGLNEEAIKKVFQAKQRPSNNPLILHVKNIDQAKNLFDFSNLNAQVLRRFFKLAKEFWPGPLTLIAKKADHVPSIVAANLKTVAVRMPDNNATLSIMAMLDFPLVMPSANLFTRPSPTCIKHVLKTLKNRIDAVVDDGSSIVGIESTVVKIDDKKPQILRPGIIQKQDIENCLEENVVESTVKVEGKPACPGQHHLHYSPLISSVKLYSKEQVAHRWQTNDIILATKKDFMILQGQYGDRPALAINFLLNDEAKQYAKELYNALYESENYPNNSLIIIYPSDSNDSLWQTILDRLKRSAGKHAQQTF
jgi:L-threonylcarbamoyladenylate synthase